MKLRAFIGSAFEDLNIANAIKNHLQVEVDCVVWDEPGVFKRSKTPLLSILEQIEQFDAGIFIFGAHDATTSRGASFIAARDNVVLNTDFLQDGWVPTARWSSEMTQPI